MNRVLEIGVGGIAAGAYPAPGLVFTDYVMSDIKLDAVQRTMRGSNVPVLGGVALDSAALPFRAGLFDTVIQRSVFGEYTMHPECTNGSLDNTFAGLYEAYRVLKNGGEIVVAEENTPWAPATPGGIGNVLEDAGFSDITVFPCQSYQNPAWIEARSRYWAIADDYKDPDLDKYKYFTGKPIDPAASFLVSATKTGGETEVFERPIVLKSVWDENRKRGWNHPDNTDYTTTISFERRKVVDDEIDDTDEVITVVSKDGTMTLAEYYEAYYAGKIPALFAH